MYSWEQIHSEVPFVQLYTLPTEAERRGDFSKTVTASGAPVTIYDPLTTRLVNGRYIRDPFPGNMIPANRMDPVALNILTHVPLPRQPGQVNNFPVPENSRADKYNQHAIKVDQTINNQHRFFVRFVWNNRHEINDYQASRSSRLRPTCTGGRMSASAGSDLGAQQLVRAQFAGGLDPALLLTHELR